LIEARPATPGTFIQAKVIGSQVYDIVAEPTVG
jgi:hypothetical protein